MIKRGLLAVLPVVALRREPNGALVAAGLPGTAVRRGFRVRQVPVAHRPRRHCRGTGARPRVIARASRAAAMPVLLAALQPLLGLGA